MKLNLLFLTLYLFSLYQQQTQTVEYEIIDGILQRTDGKDLTIQQEEQDKILQVIQQYTQNSLGQQGSQQTNQTQQTGGNNQDDQDQQQAQQQQTQQRLYSSQYENQQQIPTFPNQQEIDDLTQDLFNQLRNLEPVGPEITIIDSLKQQNQQDSVEKPQPQIRRRLISTNQNNQQQQNNLSQQQSNNSNNQQQMDRSQLQQQYNQNQQAMQNERNQIQQFYQQQQSNQQPQWYYQQNNQQQQMRQQNQGGQQNNQIYEAVKFKGQLYYKIPNPHPQIQGNISLIDIDTLLENQGIIIK